MMMSLLHVLLLLLILLLLLLLLLPPSPQMLIISILLLLVAGTAVAQWLRCCATNRKFAGSIPGGVSGFFIDIKFFRSHYGPGVDSASNTNEYQGVFPGGKGGRCVRLTTLPPSCVVVTKSGNLNILEPSRPVQAYNGTALLFTITSINTANRTSVGSNSTSTATTTSTTATTTAFIIFFIRGSYACVCQNRVTYVYMVLCAVHKTNRCKLKIVTL